jgi:hypothetical protein
MIYINANTAEEIALALRGQGGEYDKIFRAKEVADRLLGKKKEKSATLVTAPRQSGKTTELLRFAEEQYPNGQFAVITLNKYTQSNACYIYRDIRGYPEVNPPLMLIPDNFKLVQTQGKALFCDDFNLFSEKIRDEILAHRYLVAAVTS